MRDFPKKNDLSVKSIGFITLISLLILTASLAFAHGLKGQGSSEFTAFMAVKKGVELYDRLVAEGKLVESWEIDLSNIEVFTQSNGNEEEFVVKFNRSKGEPKSVFIFFSQKGEYKGSNFSGD